jgi:hypothetical protein
MSAKHLAFSRIEKLFHCNAAISVSSLRIACSVSIVRHFASFNADFAPNFYRRLQLPAGIG